MFKFTRLAEKNNMSTQQNNNKNFTIFQSYN